ncbi:MAG TPA: PAS domain S-box protein [Bacteroidales bacterium]|nr:PAS domain S-box protein [Bacteroidales bacterium]
MARVLIADDKSENLYLLKAILEAEGYEVISARNGAEALGLIRTNLPDLIISDVLMPVMDGFTLCRECKKDTVLKAIPFLFYTATYTDPKDEEFALKLGAEKYIIKPQEPDDFLKIITESLRKKKAKPGKKPGDNKQDEAVVLKEYNEVLIRKIEEKMLQSERSEKELRQYSEKLEKEIIEHKKSEMSLFESQQLFKTLTEVTPVGIFRTNPKGETTYVNPKWCELSGLKPEEALGNGWIKALHPFDKVNVIRNWEKDIRFEGESNAEYRFLHENGDTVWVIGRAVPEIIGDKVVGYIGTITDITGRKKSEEALRGSEEKYRRIFENVQDVYYETTVDGIILEVSPSIVTLSRGAVGREDLIGKQMSDYYSYPDERNSFISMISDKGYVMDFEVSLAVSEGIIVPCSISSKLVYDKNGDPEKIVGSLRDITLRKEALNALRESEEMYRSIYDNSNIAILLTIPDGTILSVNDCACRLFGRTEEEICSLGRNSLVDLSDKRLDALLEQRRKTGKASGELTFIKNDGSTFQAEVSSVSFRDRHGNLKTSMTVRDLTEQHKAEADLIREKNKAEESDRLKTAFLHNISHEIRTPMNAIVGFSALLEDPSIDEATRASFIETIINSSNHLLSIITEIIEISNIEAGIIKLKKQNVEVDLLMHNLYDQFKPLASRNNIEFDMTFCPERDFIVFTDNTKLIQILSNLLSNAFKFTQNGKIRMGCRKTENELQFFVTDTGIGIAHDQLERIFDRFYQVEHLETRHFEGTGLGLSISKAYAELLGGRIKVISEIGKGSEFHLILPIERLPDIIPGRTQTDTELNFSRTVKILIAEDNINNFNLIKLLFKKTSIETLHAKNGEEAVNICKSEKNIDLVLMDLKMPEMDGYEATEIITKLYPQIPVIAQTAFITDREKALNCGCKDILNKPFSKAELFGMVAKYLKI